MVATVQVSGIELANQELPSTYRFEQNYPNPFNSETGIRFQLPAGGEVRIDIYNTVGQRIRTLVDNRYTAGYHIALWDGRDDNGSLVSSGIHLYQIQVGQFVDIRKITLLKSCNHA
jgi:hypothetical protein